jgi:putative membrane protein
MEELLMPRIITLFTIGLLATTGAAYAPATVSPVSIASAETKITKPAEFAKMAAISNMFEIKSSELALAQATDSNAKAFAKQMIEDHSKAGEEMKSAAAVEKVTLPTELDKENQGRLDALKAASKAGFDKMYFVDQLAAHEAAVTLFSVYASSGQDGALKDFAAKTLATLAKHLEHVKTLN